VKRILVVDDQRTAQGIVSQILFDAGYDVESAMDGREALEKIEASPPDLVILDLLMPVMDGWKVLERLRRIKGAPPVVVLSGQLDKGRAMEAGAAASLPKPFTIEALLATCARILLATETKPKKEV
jgi:CheY-like chemotaxis protein